MASRSKKGSTTKNNDPIWEYCTRINGNRMNLKCNYCGLERWGGINRMKHHFAGDHDNVAPCTQCPDNVRELCIQILGELERQKVNEKEYFQEEETEVQMIGEKRKTSMDVFVTKGKEKQQTLNAMGKKREPVVHSICRFLYGRALPFVLVKSPLFASMMEAVGEYGKGLKLPSYHEARVTFFKKEVDNVNSMLEKYKKEWKMTGCTLMSDGWTDRKSRSLTNFLVNSPSGTVFLKSIDTSDVIKDAQKLFELLDSLVEEIGEENVVQVVTDSASAYVATGDLLMEKRKKLFWSPCATHCIDLILHDIGGLPIFTDTIKKAKEVCVYIYRHAWVLSMFRKFSKKRELKRPGVTRFATSFLTLRSFEENKIPLRAMFASEEWAKSHYASKVDAIKVGAILLSDDKFWKSIKYCLKCVSPLVKVLRLVDGDVKPAMGYIYEAMDRAKEKIAQNFNHQKIKYERIWNIIDTRWDLQLHRPLHAAGYFLNPK
ncbi:uncharacterized protein LOC127798293 [Diospyros lotus]|uniref:uncharacterized protein LOC127798293 n=1 Tax=Diospyros lotus TaxID=55363 RepID=UPI00225436BD|nr:uncharacterized protein LOC127798293 [Diospyros lotus]